MNDRIDIVIPNYNGKPYILNIIDYFKKFDWINLLVVDDCSPNKDAEDIIQKGIPCICNAIRKDYTKTVNVGLREILKNKSDDPIVIMNNDIVPNSQFFIFLIKMKEFLERDPSIGLVLPHNAILDKKITWIGEDSGIVKTEGMFMMPMIRRKVFNEIGLLEENFITHCSDSYFQDRVKSAGYKIGCIKNSDYFIHIGRHSTKQIDNQNLDQIKKDRELLKNRRKILQKG